MTPEKIRKDILAALNANLETREGGFLATLTAPVSVEIWKLYQAMNALIPIAYVDESSGGYIDLRCGEFGLVRKPGTRARAELTLTGKAGVTVPKDTAFLTEDGLEYSLLENVTLTGGADRGTAEAIAVGARYNIEAGELTQMVKTLSGLDVWQNELAAGGTAWHCGRSDGKYVHPKCRNANSIGIEMCCHQKPSGTWYFDPETIHQTAILARDLIRTYRIPIDHVIRHYDVTHKNCPAPFVEDSKAWEAFKERLVDEMTQEQFNEMFEKAMVAREAKQAAKPVAAWAETDRTWAMSEGLTDGTRPCNALTRQELWATMHRQSKEGM